MFRVFWARNGSIRDVAGSGSSVMSDSLMLWNPVIDEPSKARPSVKTPSLSSDAGTVKCCIWPGRSQNRTSTYFTPSSEMYLKTSS